MFVVSDGEVFVALGDTISRFDASGQHELTAATNVAGIAVDGTTLYWTEVDRV